MATHIYQIQYSDDVIGSFDPAFIKYDCRNNPEPEKREIAHMLRFYKKGLWKSEDVGHFGIVSPKFSSKTGITGKAFVEWINANPGYDVYFINPFPQLAYWHYNVWMQGEFWHPGLSALANMLFMAAGLVIPVENMPRNTAASLLYCNYWVGNENFWHLYMTFVNKFVAAVDGLNAADRKKLFELAPHYAQATYFPFFFERLFSTFLVLYGEISSLQYSYGYAEILDRCDNDMERFIIREWAEMIEAWDSTGRDDAEYRKLFANISGMLRVYLSALPALNTEGNGLIDKLKLKLNLVLPH